MHTIELTQGKQALVDDADFSVLNEWKWCAEKKPHTYYVVRKTHTSAGPRLIQMSRFLMGIGFGDRQLVDHIDGNGLNNQRRNLRLVSPQQNRWNTQRPLGLSGLLGVTHRKDRRKCWRVSIEHNGKRIYLGSFADKLDAARVYDAIAKELRGDFAALNQVCLPERLAGFAPATAAMGKQRSTD